MISSTKNEEMSSGNDEKEMQRQNKRQQEANQIFAMHCENSQGLRKFCNHSENFAIPVKFLLCTFFR